MCGIVAIVERDPARTVDLSDVHRMVRTLVHRGPDEEGLVAMAGVGLGMRRLSIVDLAGGQQPFASEDGAIQLVANGEIYNSDALRSELIERGHRFRSRSDIEVLVHGYEEWGDGFLGRVRGMFALALWDRRMRTLFLARDRYGIKPLYVARRGARVAFASEIAPLLAGGGIDATDLDRRQIRRYLAQKYTDPSATILRAVTQVPPATVLEIGLSGARSWRYWTPPSGPFHDDTAGGSAEERLETMLRDAVRRQLVLGIDETKMDIQVGMRIILEKCHKCHTIERVFTSKKTLRLNGQKRSN